MASSDQVIYRVADDISKYSRDEYERILVDLGLYTLNWLHDPEGGYTKILSKKEFIIRTLEERGMEPLLDALVAKGMLSENTISALQKQGYKMPDVKKITVAIKDKSSNTGSNKSVSAKSKTAPQKETASKNSLKAKKHNGLNWKIPTAIIVAVIGCAGTFITALFGYLAIRSQIEIPIKTTQTAEAVQEYLTANTPTEIAFTPTPNINWNEVLRGTANFRSPCATKVVPENIFLDPNNIQLSLSNFNDEFNKQFGQDWNGGLGEYLSFDLESYSQLNWVKVENRFTLHVFVESDIPNDINIVVISGCGGGSSRLLEDVELISQVNMREYKVSLKSPDVDFFTLQPGEFEYFLIPLECKAPGIYSFAIEIYAEYLEGAGRFTISPPTKMYCPYRFNKYHSFGSGLEFLGKFEWNGSEYQLVP